MKRSDDDHTVNRNKYHVQQYPSRIRLRHLLAHQPKPTLSPLLDDISMRPLTDSCSYFKSKDDAARHYARKALTVKYVVHLCQRFGRLPGLQKSVQVTYIPFTVRLEGDHYSE